MMDKSTYRRLRQRWTRLFLLFAMFVLTSGQSDDFYKVENENDNISPQTSAEKTVSMKENTVPTQGKTKLMEVEKEPSVWEDYQEATRRLLVVQVDTTVSEPIVSSPEEAPVDPNRPPGLEELELLAFNLEYADEHVLVKLIDWAYDWVSNDQGHQDKFIRARDLPEFFHRALNPADNDIDAEEYTLLSKASHQLREEQGLLDDEQILHRGFLARGHPLRYVRNLAHEMHIQHSRRLQAVDQDL